ncbi:hypothetical protein PLESTB_001689600 [Pleodorina starrii]|uniref:Uncharacterized protein n=1 Tax=Pleodorina starrii TaxID=330485 RepID=A0A9W6BZ94_9CHLO|nr:hypothetical protein PLESTB_001689600 [Pleodorina starrii]
MDADATKRAAAAEARRQKILARGAERLSRITVGTPLTTTDASESSAPSELAAPAAATPDQADASSAGPSTDQHPIAAAAAAPTAVDVGEAAATSLEAAVAEEASVPAAVLASADPMLQEVLSGSGGQLGQDTAALQAAQRDAEQALHMLLNQLAGSGGAPFLARQPQSPSPSSGVGPSGRTAGMGGNDGEGSRGTAAAAATGARRSSPSGATTPAAATAAGSGSSRLLLALAAAVAAFAGLFLGPQLTAAVEATRRLRCAAAVALAALLYGGVVEPAHLQLPAVVALLVLQVALIGAARALGGTTAAAAAAAGGRSALGLGLGKSASGADLANGSDADDVAGASSAAAAPSAAGGAAAAGAPPARFDWAALVPGLRPLLDKLSSAGALVSGLFGDMAVFVVSYLVLDAYSQVAGRRAVVRASP